MMAVTVPCPDDGYDYDDYGYDDGYDRPMPLVVTLILTLTLGPDLTVAFLECRLYHR